MGAHAPATIAELAARAAAAHPGAPALLAPGRPPLTFAGLAEEVSKGSAALGALGIGRGDRVATVLPNSPVTATVFLAVVSRAACAPLNPASLAGELEASIRALRVTAVLTDDAASPAASAARAAGVALVVVGADEGSPAGAFTLAGPPAALRHAGAPEPSDLALLLQTSGTTSRPKTVPLTHANIVAAALRMAESLELTAADRCLNVMPLFHIHGLSTVYASLAAGASLVAVPAFDPTLLVGWMEEFRPTWLTAAPTIHRAIVEVAREKRLPGSLRFVRSASAPMPTPLLSEAEKVLGVPFLEAYGMTETSPLIASNPLPPRARKLGSVGLPAGTEVAVLDPAGAPLPAGATGEVAVRGPNVMAAYEDDPAANASAFVNGWLRTGDEGHRDADGYLFITGRLKEVINRGGEKIAPREVDEALLAHPAVAQAIAFPVPHYRLGEDVAAAVVLRPGASVNEAALRASVAERLAEFKVPARILFLKELPRAATAKVKRIGLAEKLGLAREEPDVPYVPPRTPAEEVLAALWSQALRVEQVGIHDSFFRLGGDSLLALKVIAQLKKTLGIALPVQAFFAGPTIAAMARAVERGRTKGSDAGAIARREDRSVAPASFVQMGLWFLDQLEPANAAYNVYRAARLRGRLSEAALAAALSGVVARHEALRTRFVSRDGRPAGVVEGSVAAPLVRIDLAGRADAEAEALRLAREEAGRPFDLSRAPLLRATLFALGPDDHVLQVVAHHIVFDLWSIGLFFHELAALYAAGRAGRPSPLAEPAVHHGDFAAWQLGQTELFAKQLAFWKEQLRGVPEIELRTDRPRGAAASHAGARLFVSLGGSLARDVKSLARREGATPYMALLAAFQALLHRDSGQTDVVVGSPIAYRHHAETEGSVGIFSNTLVLRTDLSGDPTYRELLGRVRAVALAAYAHQDVPFEQLVDGVQPAKNRAAMPLFQVNFRVQDDPSASAAFEGLSLSWLKLENGRSKFDLAFELFETAEGLGGFWEWRTALFDRSTVERLARRYERLLSAAVAAPDSPIGSLDLGAESDGGKRPRLAESRRRAVGLADA
jgi:acyl-CoA synthetase (AMP-forming)/AMP-acid ligase II